MRHPEIVMRGHAAERENRIQEKMRAQQGWEDPEDKRYARFTPRNRLSFASMGHHLARAFKGHV